LFWVYNSLKGENKMKILVAADGTKQGDSAIEMLGNLRLGEGDEIKIVSVVDMAVPLAIDVYGGYLPDTTELEKAARGSAERVLETAINRSKEIASKAATSGEVLFGSPESRIVETAEQINADLIVLGSHGYNRWERLLLGSVSNSVMHHAPCSVLIVRTRAEK
jgi:nucleotide-binding universal stress UspA family protein